MCSAHYNKILTWILLKLTCAISTSPYVSKYSLSCCSVVFHGKPSTIKSEHFNFVSILLVLAVEFSKWSSDFLLFSEIVKLLKCLNALVSKKLHCYVGVVINNLHVFLKKCQPNWIYIPFTCKEVVNGVRYVHKL